MLTYCSLFSEDRVRRVLINLEKQRQNNLFSHVFALIGTSRFRYGLLLLDGESEIQNLNINWDERFKNVGDCGETHKKPAFLMPPAGFDGYVKMGLLNKYRNLRTKSKKVNIFAVVWHELFELYLMLDKEMSYCDAHAYVRTQEIDFLIPQLPGFTEYPAGESLVRI